MGSLWASRALQLLKELEDIGEAPSSFPRRFFAGIFDGNIWRQPHAPVVEQILLPSFWPF
jgi:hypothetical protein